MWDKYISDSPDLSTVFVCRFYQVFRIRDRFAVRLTECPDVIVGMIFSFL